MWVLLFILKQVTKKHIFEKFINEQNLFSYLPPLTSITREFLLSVLFYGDRNKYLELYDQYKDIQIQKSTSGNRKFTATVTNEMIELLKNYNPVDL